MRCPDLPCHWMRIILERVFCHSAFIYAKTFYLKCQIEPCSIFSFVCVCVSVCVCVCVCVCVGRMYGGQNLCNHIGLANYGIKISEHVIIIPCQHESQLLKSRALLKSCFTCVTANCTCRMFTMATAAGNYETIDSSTVLDSFVCTVLLYNDKFASVHQYAPAKPNAPDTIAGRTNGTSTQDTKSLTGPCPALVCLGFLVEVSRSHSHTHTYRVCVCDTRTLGRISLDEWSARRGDLYLTTYNRQTFMPLAGFEPAITASELPRGLAY
jgi:hypothetical protein